MTAPLPLKHWTSLQETITVVEFITVIITNHGAPVDIKRGTQMMHSAELLINSCITPECDSFTEWTSSIDIDCRHLESILYVWCKVIDDVTCCHYWLVQLYFSVSTTGCIILHNIANDWPILLSTRQLPPPKEYFSGSYKCCLQWLWSSWRDWVYKGCWCNYQTKGTSFIIIPAVNVLACTGPVESTLLPLNPVWLTVKM